jgi:DNA polymerase-1
MMQFDRSDNEWKPSTPPELKPGERVSIDFESTPGQPWTAKPIGIGVYSRGRKQGWYLPWAHQGGGNLPEEIVSRWIDKELAGREMTGLNTKYEVHMAYNMGKDPRSWKPRDTAYMAALLDEYQADFKRGGKGFSLEALAEKYLPEGERKQHPCTVEEKNFYLSHAGEVADRCISDAFLADRLDEVMMPQIEKENLTRVLNLENICIHPTAAMERRGLLIDRPKLDQWLCRIDEDINTLFKKTHDDTGLGVNPNKASHLEVLFEKLKLKRPTSWDEDTKQYLENWTEEAISEVDHPVVERVARLKKLMSIKSKYLEKFQRLADSNGILRFHLHQLKADENGTVTGRYSSGSKTWQHNVQQWPKSELQVEEGFGDYLLRALAIAAPGKLCGASDASQIEFRLFGHLAKSKFITDAYGKNPWIDFHMMVTRMMKPHLICPSPINGDFCGDTKNCPMCKALKGERKHMKHNNFGVIYGMGRPKLARKLGLGCTCPYNWYERDDNNRMVRYFKNNKCHDHGCPAMLANNIMDEYEKKFPEAKDQLEAAAAMAEELGFVTTALGRRRRFPDGERLHSALNCRIQGTAADYFKLMLAQLWEHESDLGIMLRAPVHDEFVYDIEPDRVIDGEARQLDEFLNGHQLIPGLRVPILWETGIGANWAAANGY